MNIHVVILNWNGKDDTIACLRSLQPCGSLRIIVVDNGSHDHSAEEIRRQFPEIQVLETGVNLGYAGGNNVGIQEALKQGAQAVLLLNNDTIIQPGFIQALVHSAGAKPEVGIWGGYPLRFSNPEILDHLGGLWNSAKGDFDLVGIKAPRGFKTESTLDYVCGCSILIRREVFEKIGFLEPQFFLFWEEADFAMRAKKAGFSIGICYEAVLLHKVSASFIGGSPHKKYFWWRSRLLWIQRNCSPQERERLFREWIKPELWHYKKLFWIKRGQLALYRVFGKYISSEKEDKIHQYRAILQAIQDYSSGTFGPGPNWLYRTQSIEN